MEPGVVRRDVGAAALEQAAVAKWRRCRRRSPRARRRRSRARTARGPETNTSPRRASTIGKAPSVGRGERRQRRDAGHREIEGECEPAGDGQPDPGAGEAARAPFRRRLPSGRRGRRAPRRAVRRRRRGAPAAASCARRGSRRRPRARSWRGQLQCRTPGSARARSSSSVPSAASTVIAARRVDVLEQERRARAAGRRQTGVGPLDEGDGVVEVGLEVAPLRRAEPDEPVEVEMSDRCRAPIQMADRERRARHRSLDPERPAGTAHERRLACAELAPEEHDVAGPEERREQAAERLGLGCRRS